MKKIVPVTAILVMAFVFSCNVDRKPITPDSVSPNSHTQDNTYLSFTDYHCRGELEGLKGLVFPGLYYEPF